MKTIDDFVLAFTDARAIEDRSQYVVVYEGSGAITFTGEAYESTRALTNHLPPGFHEVERWSNSYRRVWVNEDDMATITYVEGDIQVSIAVSRVAWVEHKVEVERFYLTHY